MSIFIWLGLVVSWCCRMANLFREDWWGALSVGVSRVGGSELLHIEIVVQVVSGDEPDENEDCQVLSITLWKVIVALSFTVVRI